MKMRRPLNVPLLELTHTFPSIQRDTAGISVRMLNLIPPLEIVHSDLLSFLLPD